MRVTKIAITTLAFLLTATSILAQAQDKPLISHEDQSQYVVSAKAGVVSTTEGEVSVQHFTPFATPEPLLSDDQLSLKDTVRTGATGRAEILLNPGCYLRLAENTEIVYLFDTFTNKIKLLRGSAIIEATVIDGLIFVETPRTKFDIVWNGLYRFNVDADGRSEVAVRKGRVMVGDTEIKEGKRAVAEGRTAMVASFNKKETDLFDDWSKRRAETLIAANRLLSKSGMNRSLGTSFLSNAWIYDPFFRSYTFLPYTSGFSSPYGMKYPVCNPRWHHSHPGYVGGGWPGSGGSGGGHSGSSGGGHSGSSGGSGSGSSGSGSNWSSSFPGSGGGGSSSPAPPVHNTGGASNTPTPPVGNQRPARP